MKRVIIEHSPTDIKLHFHPKLKSKVTQNLANDKDLDEDDLQNNNSANSLKNDILIEITCKNHTDRNLIKKVKYLLNVDPQRARR